MLSRLLLALNQGIDGDSCCPGAANLNITMSDIPHPDPRMGDDEEATPSPIPSHKEVPSHPTPFPRVSRKGVKLQLPTTSMSSSEESDSETGKKKAQEDTPDAWYQNPLFNRLLLDMQWIPANFTWQKFQPVIRGTIVAFVSVLLLVIMRAEIAIGNVSFRRYFCYSTFLTSLVVSRPAFSFSSVCFHCRMTS